MSPPTERKFSHTIFVQGPNDGAPARGAVDMRPPPISKGPHIAAQKHGWATKHPTKALETQKSCHRRCTCRAGWQGVGQTHKATNSRFSVRALRFCEGGIWKTGGKREQNLGLGLRLGLGLGLEWQCKRWLPSVPNHGSQFLYLEGLDSHYQPGVSCMGKFFLVPDVWELTSRKHPSLAHLPSVPPAFALASYWFRH